MSHPQTPLPTVGPDFSRQFPGFEKLTGPHVVIDEASLLRNIATMAARVGGHAQLHPHVKTHKSLEIARLQRQHGATGFTAARPYEALMLLEAGLGPVTLAYPMLCSETIASLLHAADTPQDIRFIADSPETVAALATGASRAGRKACVFLKVDVGLHRCGIDPDSATGTELARQIDANATLEFAGLLSHAGHAYGAGAPDKIVAIAGRELEIMATLRARLEGDGLAVPCVSIGSTPTIVANAGFEGVDQVRPGNYVFYDLTAVRLGLVDRRDIALGVAAQIISVNKQFAVANVGSKTLSSDLGAHGTSTTTSFGEAWTPDSDTPLDVVKLSEEHAFLNYSGTAPAIGTPILILPNHSCPVANLSGGMRMLSANPRLIATEGFVKR